MASCTRSKGIPENGKAVSFSLSPIFLFLVFYISSIAFNHLAQPGQS